METTNHRKTIDFVEALIKKPKLEEINVLNIHAVILDRIDTYNAGFYRRVGVRITETTYFPPKAKIVLKLMQEVCELLNTKTKEPIETAALIHLKFVNIHLRKRQNRPVAVELILNEKWLSAGNNSKSWLHQIAKSRASKALASSLTSFLAK